VVDGWMRHVPQPTATTCGQACLAMITGDDIAAVLAVLPSKPCGTYIDQLVTYLRSRGWVCEGRLRRVAKDRPPPHLAIARLKWPDRAMGHWVVWGFDDHYKRQTMLDPRTGALDEGWRLTSYLEVGPPRIALGPGAPWEPTPPPARTV
jgi:hypothetical protein